MKYYLSLFILSFLFTSHSFSQNGKMIDHIAAIIGNEIILQSDIEAQYQTQNLMMQENATEQEAKCFIMEELLYQKLLLNQAQLDSIEITDDQVESELERRMRYFTNQIGSEQKLEEYYGKSILEIKAEFRELVKNQLLIQTIQSKITDNIKATPSDIRNYFESIPLDSLPFINSELEIAQIVKKPDVNEKEKLKVKEKLENLRQRIINGENFGTLAYLYSEDPLSAKQNGELGLVPRGSLVPEFEAVAFRLSSNPDKNGNGGKGNEVSDIIETLYGFHILQLIERMGEMVNVRHILLIPKVSPEDLAKAKVFLDSITVFIENDTLTFAEAAMKFSDDIDTKANGGMMINQQDGTTRLDANQLDPVLSFMIDKMNAGEVTEPVLMNAIDGKQAYRLLKLISRTDPHVANLKDDYNRIQKAALAEKQNTAINKWMKKKQANTYMKIDDVYKKCNFAYDWFTP